MSTKSSDAKQHIIDTAYQIICANGPQGLTTRVLIAEAGISKGALYHHFSCLEEVVSQALERALYQACIHLLPSNFNSVEELLQKTGDFLFEEFFEDKQLNGVMYWYLHLCMFDDHYRERLHKALLEQFSIFVKGLCDYTGDQLNEKDADRIARLFDMMINGLGIHVQILRDIPRQRQIWDDFSEMLLLYIEHNKTAKKND